MKELRVSIDCLRKVYVLAIAFFITSSAFAQEEVLPPQQKEALENREHESTQSRMPFIDPLTYETQAGLPLAASKIYFTDKKFSISGFGEVNYINYRGAKNIHSDDIELYMTNLYRFVTYMAYKPINWLVLYGEIFAEFYQDGNREFDHELFVEVFADFLINPHFNVRAGTSQTQIGYVNNHDEPVMFFSVNRPDVERIIIPSQWIDLGVMTYGAINKDLSYTLSAYQGLDANHFRGGTWIRGGREDGFRMNFNSLILNSQLTYTGLQNTTLNINGMFTRSGDRQEVFVQGNTYEVSANTGLIAGYSRTELDRWTIMLLGTYGWMDQTERIHALTGEVLGRQVYGAYVEVGYDLLPSFRRSRKNVDHALIKSDELKLPVFVRYERLNTHYGIHPELLRPEYPIFATNLHALTTGVNFNPRRNIVLKSNYQFRWNKERLVTGEREGNRFELGMGFIF